MASGTITLNHTNSYFEGEIRWSSSTSVSDNASYIYAALWIWKDDGYTTSGTYKGSFTVGNETVSISSYYQLQSEACVAEISTTIYHSSNGTGSCYMSAEVNGPSGTSLSSASVSGSQTVTLDTIPRASSISSAYDTYFGSACQIKWQPLSSSFYYKLKFSMGSWSYTTGAIGPGTTSSYTYTGYTIPLTVASQIPNTTYGTMSVSLYTYNSSSCSTQIGSTSTASFKVTIPDSVVPTISACTASISNSNSVVAGWGIALAGYSKVNLSATASGVYGSTISSFSITGGYTVTVTGSSLDYTGDVITSSGNKEFVVKCTDSRGRVSQEFTTNAIQFLSYTLPKVRQLSMSKDTKNDDNAANDRMVAVSTWEIDSVNGNNYATAKIYYKVSSASNWITHSGTLTNGVAFELTDLVPDELLSYNFKVIVTDALGNSAEKDAFSSTVTVLLDFKAGGDGLGIGKICENPGLEVSMDAKFYNEVYIGDKTLEEYIKSKQNQPKTDSYILNIVYPIGSIYMSVESTSPASLFGGSWTQLQGRFLIGASSSYTAGSTGGEATHVLTVSEMPSHNHWGSARFEYDTKSGTHPSAEKDGINVNLPETDNTGGGAAHNNMPPYLAVYMWKRVS